MCLFNQPKPPSAPEPPALPPPQAPPIPKPEPLVKTTDLQENKEGTKIKTKSSARDKAGLTKPGSDRLTIPLNTGIDKPPTGGLNV